MGLCKCQRRKVTNLFCFEHRENVCEDCIASLHTKCIIKSYLNWLDDSDYNPSCHFCQNALANDECIRLLCYDIFHKDCLNSWAGKYPANTAPAGYLCPVCQEPVFPPSHVKSPVRDALFQELSNFSWARAGLGLPLFEDESGRPSKTVNATASHSELASKDDKASAPTRGAATSSRGEGDGAPSCSTFTHPTYTTPSVVDAPVAVPQHRVDTTRRSSSSESRLPMFDDCIDADENKYKRRSALTWFARLLRTLSSPSRRHHQSLVGGRRRLFLLLLLVGAVLLLVFLAYFGRDLSSDDPMLDPLNNPNLRVAEE